MQSQTRLNARRSNPYGGKRWNENIRESLGRRERRRAGTGRRGNDDGYGRSPSCPGIAFWLICYLRLMLPDRFS